MTDKASRDTLAALMSGYSAATPLGTFKWSGMADAILAAGWKPPGTTFDVCGHGRRADESCILCERVAP